MLIVLRGLQLNPIQTYLTVTPCLKLDETGLECQRSNQSRAQLLPITQFKSIKRLEFEFACTLGSIGEKVWVSSIMFDCRTYYESESIESLNGGVRPRICLLLVGKPVYYNTTLSPRAH